MQAKRQLTCVTRAGEMTGALHGSRFPGDRVCCEMGLGVRLAPSRQAESTKPGGSSARLHLARRAVGIASRSSKEEVQDAVKHTTLDLEMCGRGALAVYPTTAACDWDSTLRDGSTASTMIAHASHQPRNRSTASHFASSYTIRGVAPSPHKPDASPRRTRCPSTPKHAILSG
ncbi:uncharacterized protein BDZ99DRAFT_472178 [Mytilinidion resinicola]|uniref:Uncharacterized protein n=1 Tax=Mytilinidion resinicola TaxID=574789 RepID=A0A6A6Z2A6_9PEZI|nr:uncharacterized protein BDZ99DRAFT_472178 [Mytilinidion resinicola]KAF2814803.1 hypothetical protein BDZ99DRAFT_472178 [Mytilinidion resinicola]